MLTWHSEITYCIKVFQNELDLDKHTVERTETAQILMKLRSSHTGVHQLFTALDIKNDMTDRPAN